jgi:DNA-binding NarL/FixJ family response regulator
MAHAVVLIADLLFGSRVQESLRAAGHGVELVGGRDGLESRLEGCDVLVVDLTDERLGGVEAVRDLTMGASARSGRPRTLGFYSHVDAQMRERATQAGFDLVVPRSRMAREGSELVSRLTAGA